MFGGDDTFAAALARQRAAQARREAAKGTRSGELAQRAAAAAEAERQKMDAFRALLGGASLAIPKRTE